MPELKFDVTKEIGVLSEKNGWTKELNMVSWNDREPRYDIRDWSPDKSKMGKGLTFSTEEILALRELLDKLELDQ